MKEENKELKANLHSPEPIMQEYLQNELLIEENKEDILLIKKKSFKQIYLFLVSKANTSKNAQTPYFQIKNHNTL